MGVVCSEEDKGGAGVMVIKMSMGYGKRIIIIATAMDYGKDNHCYHTSMNMGNGIMVSRGA